MNSNSIEQTMKEKILQKQLKVANKELFNKNIKSWILYIVIILEIFFIFRIFTGKDIKFFQKDYIAVVEINKPITTKYANNLIKKLEKLEKSKKAKEILVIVNSPGGSPSASAEIGEYLKYINKHKKVTLYVEGMAASGAYYIASYIKPLISNPNAIIGSIGVIMPHYNFSELAKKVGVKEDYIAMGKYKKPVSYFKSISEEDKKYLTTHLLKPVYNNFLRTVAINRGLNIKELSKYAEGKVFIANDSKIKNILVDRISYLYKVKEEIKNRYNDIVFVNVTQNHKGLFPLKSDINLNLNTLGGF